MRNLKIHLRERLLFHMGRTLDLFISPTTEKLWLKHEDLKKFRKNRGNQFVNLVTVSLIDLGISSADPSDQIKSVVPCIKELDLSRNLLCDWFTIGQIVEGLPMLEILRLNRNRIKPVDHTLSESILNGLRISFSSLTTLSLNSTLMPFHEVVNIARFIPNIKELHLEFNHYEEIDLRVPVIELSSIFSNLVVLNLGYNNLSDWSQIIRFSHLPSLTSLHLPKNKIKSISFESQKDHFSKLSKLNLRSNLLSEWKSIDSLASLKKLEELKLNDNPVYNSLTRVISRTQTISRLPYLVSFNGSEVTPKERRDCELHYINLIATDLQAIEYHWGQKENGEGTKENAPPIQLSSLALSSPSPDAQNDLLMDLDQEKLLSYHPRYHALVQQHGEAIVSYQPNSNTLKSKLNKVTFMMAAKSKNEDVQAAGEMKVKKKKITPTLTVKEVKKIAMKLLGLGPAMKKNNTATIRLWLCTTRGEGGTGGKGDSVPEKKEQDTTSTLSLEQQCQQNQFFEIELDDDLKEVGYYGVGTETGMGSDCIIKVELAE